MPTEAFASSKLKEFKFRVELNGLTAALCQEFDPGDRTVAVVEYAGAGQNHPVKEAGMLKYENAILKMVVPVDGPGRQYWNDWMDQVQNPATGNGEMPTVYQRNFSLYELAETGNPSIVTEFYRAWPVQIKKGNRSATNENKTVIEEIHIAYESREQRVING